MGPGARPQQGQGCREGGPAAPQCCCASVSPAIKVLPAASGNTTGSFTGSRPAPRLTRPAGWEQDASTAFKPAHPGAPAQLPANPPHPLAQGRGCLAAGLQAPHSSSRSSLQAPAGQLRSLFVPCQPGQRPRKPTLGTPGQGNPSSCPHPAPAQGSPCQSILPLEAVQPNPTAPAKRLGAEPRRCSAIPTLLGQWVHSPPHARLAAWHRDPPFHHAAVSIHKKCDDPSAGSRQVEAGSCLPSASPDSTPRGLIPACKY